MLAVSGWLVVGFKGHAGNPLPFSKVADPTRNYITEETETPTDNTASRGHGAAAEVWIVLTFLMLLRLG